MPRSWPLEPLRQQQLLVLASVLVVEQRGRPERWWRIEPQHKTALVGSRFVSALHARGSTGAHANP